MNEKTYKLVDASVEENQKFAESFSELLKNFPELNITANIVKKSVILKMEDGKMETVFFDSPTLLIQKKIEVVEPIVSPVQSNELDKKD